MGFITPASLNPCYPCQAETHFSLRWHLHKAFQFQNLLQVYSSIQKINIKILKPVLEKYIWNATGSHMCHVTFRHSTRLHQCSESPLHNLIGTLHMTVYVLIIKCWSASIRTALVPLRGRSSHQSVQLMTTCSGNAKHLPTQIQIVQNYSRINMHLISKQIARV